MNAPRSLPILPPHVVQLSHADSQPPIFLVHATDGGAAIYEPMAESFRGHHSVYVLEDALLDEPSTITPSSSSVKELAVEYLTSIRSIQPKGPYLLGGYSFGGLIALEIAQELVYAGEQVEQLFLMEAPNPGVLLEKRALGQRVTTYLESRRLLGEYRLTAALSLVHRTITGAATRVGFELQTAAAKLLATKPRSRLRSIWVQERNTAAYAAYRATKPYGHPCHLWVCQDQGDKFVPAVMLGWTNLLPGLVASHEVPGNHLDFMKPTAMKAVAQTICETLRN